MRTSLVLTVIGADRPGIVEQISDQVLAAGANWEESRMARLAGKFAGVLRVSVDAERANRLVDDLRALASADLTIVIERGHEDEVKGLRAVAIEIVGHDRKGIVRDISHVLARCGANIEELETEVTGAAMSGEPTFRARAHVRLPNATSVDDIRAALEAMADNLMVDLELDEHESTTHR
jgi:glycine cleavage system regulatory protein